MERREFLKLFGFGTVAMGAVALTMSPAAAAAALRAGPVDATSADELIARMAAQNAGSEEFAQYRHDPRYPRRRPRRRRICRRERTRWGWRTVCRWAY